MDKKNLYVGLDVHKASISVTVAEEGRDGAVRFFGAIPNTPDDIAKLAQRLGKDGSDLDFCYEAGCCGYGIYRQLVALGHACTVAAPSLIARKPGERIKTDRRDSRKLALQHRAGDLTPVSARDADYIGSCLEVLREDNRAIVRAASQASKAADWILSFLPDADGIGTADDEREAA